MEYLLDINQLDERSLSNLKLHSPIPIQGGSYLAKITLNDNPILFQLPKCSTKKGIISSGKRFYCDLLFKYDDSNVIDFIDELETVVRNKILEKNELWFQDPPSLEDIEYNWNESIKQTKQQFYLRTYIGNTKNIKSTISVYNSNQEQIALDDVNASSNIITIVELTGLKFSSNSFHMNYCLRQVMVLEEKPIFNKCLINFSSKKGSKKQQHTQEQPSQFENKDDTTNEISTKENLEDTTLTNENIKLNIEENDNMGEKSAQNDDTEYDLDILNTTNNLTETSEITDISNKELQNTDKNTDNLEETNNNEEELNNNEEEINNNEEEINNNQNKNNSEKENIEKQENESNTELQQNKEEHFENTTMKVKTNLEQSDDLEIKEVELDMPEEEELFQLKKPDTVYLDIYNKALQKAKDAKIKAIQAYLELKEIKNKYMIQEVDEDDDNFNDLHLEF
jgi:hypothetical protein